MVPSPAEPAHHAIPLSAAPPAETLPVELEAARLEAARLVARTAAHHVNNALAPVVGFAELLALAPEIQAHPVLKAYAEHLLAAGQRAAAAVSRLQHLTRLEVEPAAPHGFTVLDLDRSTAP
jgi:signal transduction histidine kinase